MWRAKFLATLRQYLFFGIIPRFFVRLDERLNFLPIFPRFFQIVRSSKRIYAGFPYSRMIAFTTFRSSVSARATVGFLAVV